jgi:hypothetical protein
VARVSLDKFVATVRETLDFVWKATIARPEPRSSTMSHRSVHCPVCPISAGLRNQPIKTAGCDISLKLTVPLRGVELREPSAERRAIFSR